MPKDSKRRYLIVADNPKTGAQVIKAELPEDETSREAKDLKKAGMKDVKIVPTSDPSGNAG